jgi:hypothetical protein
MKRNTLNTHVEADFNIFTVFVMNRTPLFTMCEPAPAGIADQVLFAYGVVK